MLQYGVTRHGLADRMTAGGGPGVLHFSGHGGTGLVLLEHRDGRPDPVGTGELLSLSRPAKGRLQLAVLSASQSAAATTAETLRRQHHLHQGEPMPRNLMISRLMLQRRCPVWTGGRRGGRRSG